MSESDDVCGYPATNGPCQNPAGEDGYCWLSTHDDDPAEREGDGRGAPEGNTNAVKVGAWSDSFVSDFLRDEEVERVKKASDALGTPSGAQELARQVAVICLEQFRRTGDERFLRRYESICDKAQIFPEETIEMDGEVTVTEELGSDKKDMLAELFDREVQNE